MDCSRSIVVPISAVEAWVRFVSKGEGGVWRYADRFVPNKLVAFHRWRHNRIGPVKVTIFTAIFNDPEPALAGFQPVPKGINYGRWHVRVADHVMTDGYQFAQRETTDLGETVVSVRDCSLGLRR